MIDELADDLVAGLAVGVRHRRLRARADELADVDADERLLGEVELAVDVTKRGQVEDDRVHLLLGHLRVRAEREHLAASLPGGATSVQDEVVRIGMSCALAFVCAALRWSTPWQTYAGVAAVVVLGALASALPASIVRGAGEMERPVVSSLVWSMLSLGGGLALAFVPW